jgi:predicted CoA-binding protein
MKRTLVIGASENPERYSNKAVDSLLRHQHEVVAIGQRKGMIAQVPIETEHPAWTDIDTVTLYLNPNNQKPLYDYILSLKPRRIIFNPGTENPELERMAQAQGINTMEACTLVLLATGQY